MSTHEVKGYISLSTEIKRAAIKKALAGPLRKETIPTLSSGMKRAELLNQDGYGIIVVFPHFSLRDPFQVLNEIFSNSTLSKRPITVPIAFHQNYPGLIKAGRQFSIDNRLIVTKETILKGKNKGKKLGEGLAEFTSRAVSTLEEGGVVIVAPQGGRKPLLGEPESPTIGTLIAQTDRKKVHNVALVSIGLGIKDQNDYSKEKVGKFNLFKKYTVAVGNTYTKSELKVLAEGDTRKIDNVVFSELSMLVPESYRNK